MTRPSFQLGDAITGEPQLYVAHHPATPADSTVEPPPSDPTKTNPFARFAAWCMVIAGHGVFTALLDKAPKP